MKVELSIEEIEDLLSNLAQCQSEGYLNYGDPAWGVIDKLKDLLFKDDVFCTLRDGPYTFGMEVELKQEVICKDGTRFDAHTLEEYLKYLALALSQEENNEFSPTEVTNEDIDKIFGKGK